MKISKVKLRNGGMKGLDLVSEKYELKGGVSFRVESKDKRNAPAHRDLIKCFEWLKKSMLLALDMEVGHIDIDGLEIKSDGYVLLGVYSALAGDFPLKSPVLSADNFSGYEALDNIIKGLLVEVKEYLEGGKVMGIDEYVVRHNKGSEGFDEKEYEGLSKEEKMKAYVSLIEKAGGFVTMPDDLELYFAEEEVVKKEEKVTNSKEVVLGVDEQDKGDDLFDISEPVREKVLVKKSIDEDDFEL